MANSPDVGRDTRTFVDDPRSTRVAMLPLIRQAKPSRSCVYMAIRSTPSWPAVADAPWERTLEPIQKAHTEPASTEPTQIEVCLVLIDAIARASDAIFTDSGEGAGCSDYFAEFGK